MLTVVCLSSLPQSFLESVQPTVSQDRKQGFKNSFWLLQTLKLSIFDKCKQKLSFELSCVYFVALDKVCDDKLWEFCKSLRNFKQKNNLSQTLEISQDSSRWKSWIYDSNFLRISLSFLFFLWMCLKYAPQHDKHMTYKVTQDSGISMKSMNPPSPPFCKDHCNASPPPPPSSLHASLF